MLISKLEIDRSTIIHKRKECFAIVVKRMEVDIPRVFY